MPDKSNNSSNSPLRGFLSASSIHGLQYLSPTQSPSIFQRLLWLSLVIFLFISSALTINSAFNSWQINPTVTTVNLVDVRRVENLFPDITVYPRITTEWRIIFSEINKIDTEDEVFNLFAGSLAFKGILGEAVGSVAAFHLVRDYYYSVNSSQNKIDVSRILDNLCKRTQEGKEEGVVGMLGVMDWLSGVKGSMDEIRRKSLEVVLARNGSLIFDNFISKNSSFCQNGNKQNGTLLYASLTLAKELLLYKSITRAELLVLLLRIVTYGKEGLLKDFPALTGKDMEAVYSYVTKMSYKLNMFPDLPWPLPVSLKFALAQVEAAYSDMLSDPSPFNTNSVFNYDPAKWNTTYSAMSECLLAPKKQSDFCLKLDRQFSMSYSSHLPKFLLGQPNSSFSSMTPLASVPLVPLCYWKGSKQGKRNSLFSECDRLQQGLKEEVAGSVRYDSTMNNKDRIANLEYGLDLVIDLGVGDSPRVQEELRQVLIYVHGQNTYPDMLSLDTMAITAKAGHITTITFEPIIFDSTMEFGQLPFQYRNCSNKKEAEERKLDMFKAYTRTNCLIDTGFARVKRNCNCTSLIMANKNLTVINNNNNNSNTEHYCGVSNSFCLKGEIATSIVTPVGNGEYDSLCPSLCDDYTYAATLQDSAPLNNMEDIRLKWPELLKYLFHWDEGQNYMSYASLVSGKALVEERLKRVAVVKINFAKSFAQKLTRDARVNFSDKLSTVGGTLGLFTGFSIVSLAEIMHWVVKAVFCGKNKSSPEF